MFSTWKRSRRVSQRFYALSCLQKDSRYVMENPWHAEHQCFNLCDYNADSQSESVIGYEIIIIFWDINSLYFVERSLIFPDTFTFVSQAHDTTTWLDHCISTTSCKSLVSNVSVIDTTIIHIYLYIAIYIYIYSWRLINKRWVFIIGLKQSIVLVFFIWDGKSCTIRLDFTFV